MIHIQPDVAKYGFGRNVVTDAFEPLLFADVIGQRPHFLYFFIERGLILIISKTLDNQTSFYLVDRNVCDHD